MTPHWSRFAYSVAALFAVYVGVGLMLAVPA